jgi:hypothetical protein
LLFVRRRSTLRFEAAVQILEWEDQRKPGSARALIQQGRCDRGECGQFAISISNGARGMTVRFESETEFRQFLERGSVEKR